MRQRRSWLFGLILVSLSRVGEAAIFDPAFTQTTLVSAPDLADATGMAWAPDGSNRLFVIRKGGQVMIIKDGTLLPTPFATVTPLFSGNECGLVGIAFDPNFVITHHVYLFATVSATEQQILRYTASGDSGMEKTTVLAGLPTNGANHDGGALGFGPDGKVYWAIGDLGGGIGVNDDKGALAAKVGRANLDGTAPADNPFVDGPGGNADLLWARGFRNPYTLTFQPATGLLWVDDVGASYEQIFIVRKGDHAGWNTYEIDQPAGFILPVIKYRTNGVDTLGILAATTEPATSGAARVGGTVTFTTGEPHKFRLGEKITVAGVADASFNGSYFVASIPGPTSFRAPQVGPDALSGGGSATTLSIGGCVTGGAFYDATGAPAGYRGNFFFGDFNSGQIERVVIDAATNTVTAVDDFANGVSQAVDMALGPDGALYSVGANSNTVYRLAYTATAQALVVSPINVWMAEGDPAVVMVRLAMMPAQDTTVTAAPSGGDTDVAVRGGGTLTFTAANWDKAQPLTLVARPDLDTTDDVGTIGLSSPGLTSESVVVHARDENRVGLQVSRTALALQQGASDTFTVVLTEQPSLDVAVTATRSSGDMDVTVSSGASLTFTRETWSTAQTVTITAAADADSTDDTATITVTTPGRMPATVMVTVHDPDLPPPDAAPDAAADAGAPDAPAVDARSTGASASDAPPASDASGRSDARIPVGTGGGGCGCRTGGAPRPALPALAMLLALGFSLRRPRRP